MYNPAKRECGRERERERERPLNEKLLFGLVFYGIVILFGSYFEME
jgi:hypothetical protein